MVWTWFKDGWLVTQRAATLFLVATVLVFIETPILLGNVDLSHMTFWPRLPWGIAAILGPVATIFLWFGMWRYWVRVDDSNVWNKRLSFLILLFGLWWGGCLYCYAVYLPQVYRHKSGSRN